MSAATTERYELRFREATGIWQIVDRSTGKVRSTRGNEDDARRKLAALNEAAS